ncbi:hypothetical protein BGZ76_002169 [Entomortierella beljakovae]|nr:hypothetical protein BGZ76_002169 [Entomortierella beljakovae]
MSLLFSVFTKPGSLPLSSTPSASFSSQLSSSSSYSSSSLPRAPSISFISLFLLISLSSICISTVESLSVSSDLPSALHISTLDLPSKVHIVDSQEKESFQLGLVDLDTISISDLLIPVKEEQKKEGSHIQKRAPAETTTTTAKDSDPTTAPKPTKSSKPTTGTGTSSGKPTMSATSTPIAPTMAPDSKGDTALFGVPSKIGAFNFTSGILIYTTFLLFFLGAIGSATWKRSKYRNQFREQQQMNMEGGRVAGSKKRGDPQLSDAALFKQASISKRALMKDVGPGGDRISSEVSTKIAAANGAGRSFEERNNGNSQSGGQVRFGEGKGNSTPTTTTTGRTGGMKKTNRGDINQGAYEMNAYGQSDDTMVYYQDNHDTSDYSRPPLTESADPYYSSGSSHSGYLDQVDDYHYNGQGTQSPKPTYQPGSSSPQSQYSQPQPHRSNSSRMPQVDGNNVYRNNSGRNGQSPMTSTQELSRAGSGGRTPIDTNMSRSGSNGSSSRTRVSPSPTMMHPTPIARSNSTRLPPSMRGGGTPQPSGLSHQTNNYDFM